MEGAWGEDHGWRMGESWALRISLSGGEVLHGSLVRRGGRGRIWGIGSGLQVVRFSC